MGGQGVWEGCMCPSLSFLQTLRPPPLCSPAMKAFENPKANFPAGARAAKEVHQHRWLHWPPEEDAARWVRESKCQPVRWRGKSSLQSPLRRVGVTRSGPWPKIPAAGFVRLAVHPKKESAVAAAGPRRRSSVALCRSASFANLQPARRRPWRPSTSAAFVDSGGEAAAAGLTPRGARPAAGPPLPRGGLYFLKKVWSRPAPPRRHGGEGRAAQMQKV